MMRVVVVALALIASVASAAEHECGKGPVIIDVSSGPCCACPMPPPAMRHLGGDR